MTSLIVCPVYDGDGDMSSPRKWIVQVGIAPRTDRPL